MEEKKYLITKTQLLTLVKERDIETRYEMYALVLTQTYREKSAGDAILGSIGKGVNSLLDVVDKATEPKAKKGSK